jgi:organic radical activating enzyme
MTHGDINKTRDISFLTELSMNNIFNRITQIIKTPQPIPIGVYHYQTPPSAEMQYRLHLRVNQEGEGLLIMNASTILHLNQTATEYCHLLINDKSPEEAASSISKKYQIDKNQARRDYLDFKEKIQTLLEIPDLDPVSFLDLSREDPYSGAITAPYRLDCALTYRLPKKSNPELAPVRRVNRELSTEEWKKIIDRSWQAGIPHLIFTGGEPTIREDLIELISYAEKHGQVTGLVTDGYRLKEDQFRNDLLLSGLDHLLFALTSRDEDSWTALKTILDEDLHTTVHLTIHPEIVPQLPQMFKQLNEFGANAVSLSISSPDDEKLVEALADSRTLAAETGLRLKWDLPVPYSDHNPISLELESAQEQLEGAGRAWFYVEPDGDLLPAQGINQVLGNLLDDNWEQLWQPRSA